MGRPPLQPPSIPHPDWIKAGCPPLEMSVAQIALWLDLSRQRIFFFEKRGDLVREGKLFRTEHPRNKAWFIDREGAPPAPKPPGRNGYQEQAPKVQKRWGDYTPKERPQNAETEELDLEVILDAISSGNLRAFTGADVQKIARLESALKTRVEREAKRGLLIDRKLVQTVFGRLFQIDANQWKPLGGKLAPELAGMFGVEDSESVLKVEQRIDEETSRVLSHVKQLIDKFLVDIGGEAVEV